MDWESKALDGSEEIEKEREWLKKEYGENHKLFETLQAKLKERKLSYIAERQKKKGAEKIYITDYHSRMDEPNYLNSHPYWGQPYTEPPPFLKYIAEIIAEWIAGKIALRKVGRKYKKRNKNK